MRHRFIQRHRFTNEGQVLINQAAHAFFQAAQVVLGEIWFAVHLAEVSARGYRVVDGHKSLRKEVPKGHFQEEDQ